MLNHEPDHVDTANTLPDTLSDPFYCGDCGKQFKLPLPVEPLYTMKQAVVLIPMTSENSLRSFLSQHKDEFPARYIWDATHRRHRLLLASEIRRLRELVVRRSIR